MDDVIINSIKMKSLLTKEATNEVDDIEDRSIANNNKIDFTNNVNSKLDIEMTSNNPKLYGMQLLNNESIVNNNNNQYNKLNNQINNNTKYNNMMSEVKTNNNTNINTQTKASKKSFNKEGLEKKKQDKSKKDKDKSGNKVKDKDKDKEEKTVKFVDEKSLNNFNTTNNLQNTNLNNNTNTIRKKVRFKNPMIEYVNIESYKLYNSLMCFSDPHFETEPKPTKCKCSIL